MRTTGNTKRILTVFFRPNKRISREGHRFISGHGRRPSRSVPLDGWRAKDLGASGLMALTTSSPGPGDNPVTGENRDEARLAALRDAVVAAEDAGIASGAALSAY